MPAKKRSRRAVRAKRKIASSKRGALKKKRKAAKRKKVSFGKTRGKSKAKSVRKVSTKIKREASVGHGRGRITLKGCIQLINLQLDNFACSNNKLADPTT